MILQLNKKHELINPKMVKFWIASLCFNRIKVNWNHLRWIIDYFRFWSLWKKVDNKLKNEFLFFWFLSFLLIDYKIDDNSSY